MQTPQRARADAIAWLAGRLRFEQLLTDLQARAGADGQPVRLAPAGARELEAA